MTDGAAIGIICKTPLPGASKTRLVPLLGPEAAAELAAAFLADFADVIETVPEAVGRSGYAVYAPEGSEAELRPLLPAHFGLLCRCDDTLGVVLLGATRQLLGEGHDCVVLVNADSPTLPPLLLSAALAALRAPGDRVVLGPATDGGYYLIGLKRPHARLFQDVPWSTSGVLAATRRRAAEIGLQIAELPLWYDVDDAETFTLLREELSGRLPAFTTEGIAPGPARATRRFFMQHSLASADCTMTAVGAR